MVWGYRAIINGHQITILNVKYFNAMWPSQPNFLRHVLDSVMYRKIGWTEAETKLAERTNSDC